MLRRAFAHYDNLNLFALTLLICINIVYILLLYIEKAVLWSGPI